MDNNFFYNFGEAVTFNTAKVENIFKDYSFHKKASENAIYDEQQIKIAKSLASIVSSVLQVFSKDPSSPAIQHLNKIASEDKELWNDHCEEVIDVCTRFLQENNISTKEFAKTAGIAEVALRGAMFPAAMGTNILAGALPISGAALGGTSYLIEKELNEDNKDNEILKAKIREWQRLSAELNKELKEIYGYSFESKDLDNEEDTSDPKEIPIKEVDEQ